MVVTAIDQGHWVEGALEMFGRVFGGATAYPRARGIWRDDERGGALVKDEPVGLVIGDEYFAILDFGEEER